MCLNAAVKEPHPLTPIGVADGAAVAELWERAGVPGFALGCDAWRAWSPAELGHLALLAALRVAAGGDRVGPLARARGATLLCLQRGSELLGFALARTPQPALAAVIDWTTLARFYGSLGARVWRVYQRVEGPLAGIRGG